MRYYDTLATYERKGFTIVVAKTWEDIDPRDCFDDCHDVDEICEKINDGTYDWFMLRVRVLLDDKEMGSAYLGGCLYERPELCLVDGTAEDLIEQAMDEARKEVYPLMRKLQAINEELEREGV